MATRPVHPTVPLSIELEMRRETVSSLRMVGRKLEDLLEELGRLEAEVAAASGAHREAKAASYRELRKQAEHQRWCLIVQREAMGLRIHKVIDELYPLPPRID